MSDDARIFMLSDSEQRHFAENDEVFPNAQLGRLADAIDSKFYLVVGGQVAIDIAIGLDKELLRFFSETWAKYRSGNTDIIGLYTHWMKSLPPIEGLICEPTSRPALQQFAATGSVPSNPPAPPSRVTVTSGGVRPPGTSTVYGHLPFQDVTSNFDIFYRFEAWPTSKRIVTGANGTIASGAFASPASELPFLPTGFAAVARNALPSLFPAVFRYELAPAGNSPILCGAVVPMFGQSGGGVEVMFTTNPFTANRGAIANPAIILPF